MIRYCPIIALVVACTSCQRSQGDLPYIDVRKNYPVKEVFLTDIADVSYLHLNSDDDDYLYRGGISCITPNTIVVSDASSGSILFFSRNGNAKSRFNRYGRGPEEYLGASYVIYDEIADDVFVTNFGSGSFSDFIQVYSSAGKHKRKITLPGADIGSIVPFDEQSFLVYDSKFEWVRNTKNLGMNIFPTEYGHSPFFLISKTDGTILDYIELPQNDIVLNIDNNSQQWFPPARVVKCIEGIHLCNPETDTVFLYNMDKSLTPIIHKTPLVSKLDPMVILNNCLDVGRHQFMELVTLTKEGIQLPIHLMRDKNTGEVFRQKLLLPEYTGKGLVISPSQSRNRVYENGYYFELDLVELKEAYAQNKLSGKLKELVATLKADDNNVFVIAEFK